MAFNMYYSHLNVVYFHYNTVINNCLQLWLITR